MVLSWLLNSMHKNVDCSIIKPVKCGKNLRKGMDSLTKLGCSKLKDRSHVFHRET